MKTKSILTNVFVVKTRKRSQRVKPLPEVGGLENRAEVVLANDLLLQTPLSHEG
jgi:hypothetical protein